MKPVAHATRGTSTIKTCQFSNKTQIELVKRGNNLASSSSSLNGTSIRANQPPSSKYISKMRTMPPTATASSAPTSSPSKGCVAITGATGLVGTRLVQALLSTGYTVRVLTRNVASAKTKLPLPGVDFYAPSNWASAISGTTAVVNLAGEPIATRWTPELKKEIKKSRISLTQQLSSAINSLPEPQRPKVFISSSAVGYYGTSDGATFSEASPNGGDYLAEVCKEWESAAQSAETRVVIIRTGIVLAKEGGALAKMIPVFQIFAGGPLGSGRQWFSWIHRDDLVGMILTAIKDDQWSGVYNGTAPNPVRMGELCSELGRVMGRPSFFPVPDFALKTLLGEGAQVVLDGQRVLPTRAQDGGYRFRYSQIGDALKNILR